MNYSAFFFAMLVVAVYYPPSDSSCTAFIFETKQTIRPDLNKIVDAQPDTRFTVSLDVGGSDKTASRMAIKGMTLDLVQRPSSEGQVVKMPGRNGPHPELSAGLRQLDFVEDGKFVSMAGVKHVRGTKGAWEVVWKDDAPAGSLLCGFELPESYSRNEATLPEGCIYLSFPVWTKETLDDMQDEKHRILTKASEFQKEKFRELEKINETNNVFEKIWCYRNALAAAEKYGLQPITRANLVPESNGVIPLNDEFLVTTTGTIWTKKPNGHQVKLGSATLKLAEQSP
mmetsp:Transcript_29322/g.70711  ORF Transcript_29322/g.70711 Transcript_29322/m.70711 type:complete len:285 (-) Transcript_29322:288-1142(-)|eukprot:CAMPEP_0113479424 /NCGR_PEP_ID=MMETSP0014_2-20120614/21302_1 /TAXON_ID=2857 /ORGANISM="Nitzschia sp." /LENGTH=284 /DNA_ID=CAMNT_0000372721 /DNA_START=108 /DNA_END=962 /DNA_ORIENTATION=- /assembly_acc=CAM_ASM_000159